MLRSLTTNIDLFSICLDAHHRCFFRVEHELAFILGEKGAPFSQVGVELGSFVEPFPLVGGVVGDVLGEKRVHQIPLGLLLKKLINSLSDEYIAGLIFSGACRGPHQSLCFRSAKHLRNSVKVHATFVFGFSQSVKVDVGDVSFVF